MKAARSIITATIATLLLGLMPFHSQEEEKHLSTRYARGSREIESRIIAQADRYLKGVQNLAVTAEMLAGFEPDYVEFFLDGELVTLDHEPPFEASIDTGQFTRKRRILIIASREQEIFKQVAAGGEQQAAGVIEGRFEIIISNPVNGNYVVGRTPIIADAEFEDDARLESVQFYVDNVLVGTVTQEPWEFIYNFGRKFNARRVGVVAFDNFGRRAESSVTTAPLERSAYFIEARVVTLDVTVTGAAGRLIGQLGMDDFEVYENGEQQEIRYFSNEERPIWVAVLIDTSGSMQGSKMRRTVFAAQQFVSQLKPADHAMIVTFGPVVNVLNEFTNDFPGLIDQIGTIQAIRNAPTPLNQSIYDSLGQFKERVGRKAIIVISDGADTASKANPAQVNELAKSSNVRIYAIAIRQLGIQGGGLGFDDQATYLMRGLADVTGGASYFPSSSSEFFNIFKAIADELRIQYSIGYVPPKITNNKWRSIKIKMKKRGLSGRTREGYYPVEM